MDNLPLYIPVVFGCTTWLTIMLFYFAAKQSKVVLLVLLGWCFLQSIIALSGFYLVTNTFPPRLLFLILIPLLLIITLFVTPKGRTFIAGLDIKTLTLLHTIRIPVEMVLLWLSMHKAIPQLMTFEGINFDILSGITAPVVYYLVFRMNRVHRKVLLIWNLVCLGLLINIVYHAIFSTPVPFQKFAFDQPNIAVLYFPFNLLPACVVPLVLLAHLASIKQLLSKPKE